MVAPSVVSKVDHWVAWLVAKKAASMGPMRVELKKLALSLVELLVKRLV